MQSTFIYSIICLFIAMVMWSLEGSKYTDYSRNMRMYIFFKFSKWFFVISAFFIPIFY